MSDLDLPEIDFVEEPKQENKQKEQSGFLKNLKALKHSKKDVKIQENPENNNMEEEQEEDVKIKKFPNSENQNNEKNNNTEQTQQIKKPKILQDPNRFTQFEDYHCMLNLTDISYGQKGHNKFYEIKIVNRKKNEFKVVFNWGRVGAKPQERAVEFDSKYEAIIEFKDKFYQKTHNQWEDKARFKTKSGKYTLIQMDNTSKKQGSLNDEINNLNNRNKLIKQRIQQNQSKLDANIKNFMENIWNIEKINKTLQQLNFDTEKNPLGKLKYEQIQKGYKILNEIVKVLQKQKISKQMIIELTNQFYTNIPQSYGMQRLPEIDSLQKVREKIHLLDVLKEIDIMNKFIGKIVQKDSNINPLDSFYDMLDINLRLIPKQYDTYKSIEKTIQTTKGPTHNKYNLEVLELLEVQRRGETQRYHPFGLLNNKYYLWHGSRITNYVGILSEGLRIAPPDAPVTGYMFGKGLYFTDVPTKAANYCHASLENNEGYLILTEVALGNIHEVYRAQKFTKPPKYFHSVKGVGRNMIDEKSQPIILNNNEDIKLLNGNVVDNQHIIKENIHSDLLYNEYVVYDQAQIQIKYIVKVRFNFV